MPTGPKEGGGQTWKRYSTVISFENCLQISAPACSWSVKNHSRSLAIYRTILPLWPGPSEAPTIVSYSHSISYPIWPPLTEALLDRLTHRVHILETNSPSFRLRESKKRLARPRLQPEGTSKSLEERTFKTNE